MRFAPVTTQLPLKAKPVNSISWAPQELGPILACASSDGKVSVLTFNGTLPSSACIRVLTPTSDDGTWEASLFAAHAIGANAVSWAPATLPGSLTSPNQALVTVKRFASGGCDGLVKLWSFRDDSKTWELEEALSGHDDWVRDAAFAPSIGLPRTYLASAGQDRKVIVWTQDQPKAAWTRQTINPAGLAGAGEGTFGEVVWRVSWSVTGNVLAVAAGDGRVTLWKENLKGVWVRQTPHRYPVISLKRYAGVRIRNAAVDLQQQCNSQSGRRSAMPVGDHEGHLAARFATSHSSMRDLRSTSVIDFSA